jgi:hypothetical protein
MISGQGTAFIPTTFGMVDMQQHLLLHEYKKKFMGITDYDVITTTLGEKFLNTHS